MLDATCCPASYLPSEGEEEEVVEKRDLDLVGKEGHHTGGKAVIRKGNLCVNQDVKGEIKRRRGIGGGNVQNPALECGNQREVVEAGRVGKVGEAGNAT